jgi:uncharacterized protein YbjT (DUF2867 family)
VSGRDAVLAGGTGLVGGELLHLLAWEGDHERVLALARRTLPLSHPRIEPRPARFDALDEALAGAREGCDVFCCLGTTIRTAGSREAFRAVDHDMVLALAHWAKRHRARRLLLVSALGADPRSRVFYNRVKGEAERDARAEGPASVVVLRPSLLDGERGERRFGEALGLALTRPLARAIPAAWRPVHARDVAAALLAAARADDPPPVIESAALQGTASR